MWLELWSGYYSLCRWGCQEKETILQERIMGVFPGFPALYWFELNTFLGLAASLPLGCAEDPGILCFPPLLFFNSHCSLQLLSNMCSFLPCNRMTPSRGHTFPHLGPRPCLGHRRARAESPVHTSGLTRHLHYV